MKATFRVDASSHMGIGHFMRCLTLAETLRQHGTDVQFVCRKHEGNMLAALTHAVIPFTALPPPTMTAAFTENYAAWLGVTQQVDADETIKALNGERPDWVIVDHYGLDAQWEHMLRPHTRKIMVIDDLANRQHECDLLLDQNYYRDLDRRYLGLVPAQCVTLLGPSYVLLRPEFTEARQKLRVRDGRIRRILVFFGGSDPTGQTQNVMEAIKLLDRPDLEVDVVVGLNNSCREAIQALCDELPNATFYCQVSNMAELIQNADIGIGAGGGAMWERCFLGLPAITVVIAANQQRTTEDIASVGAIEYLGWYHQLDSENYARAIVEMIKNPQRVKQIGEAALGLLQAGGGDSLEDVMQCITKNTEFLHTSSCVIAQ